jgi:hypothetical protein
MAESPQSPSPKIDSQHSGHNLTLLRIIQTEEQATRCRRIGHPSGRAIVIDQETGIRPVGCGRIAVLL